MAATARPAAKPAPGREIEIARIIKNHRELLRVTIREYGENTLVDVRLWTASGGQLFPTKDGVSISSHHLPHLHQAVGEALKRAADLGWIDTMRAAP